MILKNPIFGVFEAKYLWKFLSISGKTYIIRIVSSRRIFEKKWRLCHMHFNEEEERSAMSRDKFFEVLAKKER